MSEYIPSPWDFVAAHVELYEGSGGTKGVFWQDTEEMRNWYNEENIAGLHSDPGLLNAARGLPTIIVTHRGRKTGAIRKTPLMTVVDGNNYILVASLGGAPQNPHWVYNLKADPNVEIRDGTQVHSMRVREAVDPVERTATLGNRGKSIPYLSVVPRKNRPRYPALRSRSHYLIPQPLLLHRHKNQPRIGNDPTAKTRG